MGKEGYYEQFEEISARLPPDASQQYDVFVHVYVASPLGDRRLGYKRYRTSQLLPENGWSARPQWSQLKVEPSERERISIHGAMLLLSLRFGTDKQVKAAAPRRPHVHMPKLMRYELRANIYQARDLQAADDNGLADPYVHVSLAGASDETQVIERTLQPIWYQTVSLWLELPRDLSLAPKISLVVYDSDALFGLSLLGEEAAPQVVGLALAPAGAGRTVKDYYVPYYNNDLRSGPEKPPEPEWLELFDPNAAELLELHIQDPRTTARPVPVGGLLASFELRPEQEAAKAVTPGSSGCYPTRQGCNPTCPGCHPLSPSRLPPLVTEQAATPCHRAGGQEGRAAA